MKQNEKPLSRGSTQ